MSQARTEPTQARPQQATAQAAAAPGSSSAPGPGADTGSGRHRGPASTDDAATSPSGRHRRASEREIQPQGV
ncbi:hypothetical protein [Streptomyces sp. NPDC003077]|uniref:hypothetical protein n=1 Tax=Streptomyces sp. NPDC003077 TaxID=3154443 RepID=UPI0033AFD797